MHAIQKTFRDGGKAEKKDSPAADLLYKSSKLPGHMSNTARFARREPCGKCLKKFESAGGWVVRDILLTTNNTIFDLSRMPDQNGAIDMFALQ
jgi:hypothetical protein